MANNIMFDNPPLLNGGTENRLQQMYSYLGTISSQLNSMVMDIEIKRLKTEETVKTVVREKEQNPAESDFIKAKSLIIKTAELVRTEMEEIRTTLTGSVDALSEQFGEYQETITQEITATAMGILQSFNIEERISEVEEEMSNFVRNQTSYIYAGILDDVTHKTGIAIGENVTNENGELVAENQVVQITSDRIVFYQNGTEVAYFSNNNFYIAKGVVTDSMQMGNFMWKVFSNGSLGLMKV